MIVSSVLSMAIRQIRHLHEKPSDFLRLPVFIIVSTFFLMPIRLLGFLRMAHASGWGTRAGAYAGGGGRRPDRRARERCPHGTGRRRRPRRRGWCRPSAPRPTAPSSTAPPAPAATPPRHGDPSPAAAPRRRRLNPLATIPYLIALVIFTLEALFYV